MGNLRQRVNRAVRTSILGTLHASLSGSQVVSAWHAARRRLVHLTRHSFVLQWLTHQPEPELIVINLRKTQTVGSVIRLLDWLVGQMAPYWRNSILKRVFDNAMMLGRRAIQTRIGRLFTQALKPPKISEPKEEDGS